LRLRLLPLRFQLRAIDPVIFPPSGAANSLRGALGLALNRQALDSEGATDGSDLRLQRSVSARLFEPVAGSLPSGLARPPRPFVLRALGLDRRSIPPGAVWSFDLYLFDLRPPSLIDPLKEAIGSVAAEGLGIRRGRSELIDVLSLDLAGRPCATQISGETPPPPLSISLAPTGRPVRRVRVRFLTPTELKAGGSPDATPEFATLFARLRDRISTLCALYGDGPLPIDFQAMGARARHVCILRAALARVHATRRSTRTGETHPLGGFTGEVDYEGELAEFLPFLHAGRWTGVGRQTVWGKGAMETVILDPPDAQP
jgi:hypothetical protein